MVSARKRGRQEMEAPVHTPLKATSNKPKESSTLDRIRNMWEFANLAQWIFIFGKAVKIDENIDIEELEMECLKPNSTVLSDIGLALLKFVSSHRGLTPEIFDEYTRRQYLAKAPERNPFGMDEEPAKFIEFDIFTKLRVLQQLTIWTLGNPDRIRERMEEQKDSEQTYWRIEPFGWDAEDRSYIVLDDNRLYRQTDAPPPPPAPKAKKNTKKSRSGRRASKRQRRLKDEPEEEEAEEYEDDEDQNNESPEATETAKIDDGLGGMKWECLAITLSEYKEFLSTIEKSRDANEKVLRKRISDEILPILEKQEEAQKRKQVQKERELHNLEKLATAKRSSRIAGKVESQKQEEEAREAERKRQADLIMAKKEQEKWMKLEKERESRMMTREQRLKEREAKRILHEEELANLSEDSKKLEAGEGRLSERHLKAEIERKKQALEQLAEEEDWIFDCICGAYGQIDDGTHSISCEKCNIWQHSKCVNVSQADADRDDFHFICKTCKRRAEEAEKPKPQQIKLKFTRPGSSSSSIPGAPKPDTLTNGHSSPTVSPQKSQPRVIEQPSLAGSSYHSGRLDFGTPKFSRPASSRPDEIPKPEKHMPQTYAGSGSVNKQPHLNGSAAAQNIRSPSGVLNGANPFSSPVPHSPTSLPPPSQSNPYFLNGQPTHVSQSPTSNNGSQSPKQMLPQSSSTVATPVQNKMYTSNAGHNDTSHRRPSASMSSPLAGAPVLSPGSYNKESPLPRLLPGTSSQLPDSSQSQQASSPMALSQSSYPQPSPILPPAVTGLSPTKNSPPRPTTANGFEQRTPHVLPPVAPLSPSPRAPNLSPPVKPSEPPTAHQNGQGLGLDFSPHGQNTSL